jgi:hypothetical protein
MSTSANLFGGEGHTRIIKSFLTSDDIAQLKQVSFLFRYVHVALSSKILVFFFFFFFGFGFDLVLFLPFASLHMESRRLINGFAVDKKLITSSTLSSRMPHYHRAF